jgi:hypothetical protein
MPSVLTLGDDRPLTPLGWSTSEPEFPEPGTVESERPLTSARLIDLLAMCARPAVRGYGGEVVARAGASDLTALARHPPGPCEISVVLCSPSAHMSPCRVGWRVDTGWFVRLGGRAGRTVGGVRYRAAEDPVDALLPTPARVAAWLLALTRGEPGGRELAPPPVVEEATISAVAARLHSYVPAAADGYACWTHARLAPLCGR